MSIINRLKIKLTKSPKKRADLIKASLDIKMGTGCQIFPDCSFGSEPYLIQLGDKVRITKGVQFITHDGGVWVLRNNGISPNADIFGKIIIGNNVHIGINSIIMPGVTIGDNVIIGAGSVVTKDVQSNSVAAGVPARYIKSIDEYYLKNKDSILETKNMPQVEKNRLIKEKIL